jgi:hypothetical protein
MHRKTIVIPVHCMGRVTNPEILKALPLMEVKVLARPPNMNRTPEISLTLRRYQRAISATNFTRPHA